MKSRLRLTNPASDHQRPQCLVCLDRAQECYYPERPLKPGPKLGRQIIYSDYGGGASNMIIGH